MLQSSYYSHRFLLEFGSVLLWKVTENIWRFFGERFRESDKKTLCCLLFCVGFVHTSFMGKIPGNHLGWCLFPHGVLPTPNLLLPEPQPPWAPSPPTPPAWWRKAPPRWRPQGRVRPRVPVLRARQGEAPQCSQGVKDGWRKKVPFQAGGSVNVGSVLLIFCWKMFCLLFAILKYHWKESFWYNLI